MPITHVTNRNDTTSQTTYNFGSVSIPSDGLVVVGAVGRSGSAMDISSVSIGWTNGDLVVSNGSNSIWCCGLFSRVVTAGSHNITVNFSGSTSLRCGIAVWVITGYNSATASDTDNYANAGGGSTIMGTLDLPTDGMALYVAASGGTGTTGSWSAAGEDADVQIEANANYFAASKTASGAADVETLTLSASVTNRGMAAAVWAPSAAGSGNPHYYYQNQAVAA